MIGSPSLSADKSPRDVDLAVTGAKLLMTENTLLYIESKYQKFVETILE